jgi:NACalpha-BTF3-like transcription factor
MVLLGVTIAVISAGVPVVQRSGERMVSEKHEARKCYSNQDVLLMMHMTSLSKESAVEVLELACAYAIKP